MAPPSPRGRPRRSRRPGARRPEPADQSPAISADLLAALRRLPPRQREVITLRLLLDLDTESTARLLGISPGTVGAHLHKAVGTLRAAIPSQDKQEVRK